MRYLERNSTLSFSRVSHSHYTNCYKRRVDREMVSKKHHQPRYDHFIEKDQYASSFPFGVSGKIKKKPDCHESASSDIERSSEDKGKRKSKRPDAGTDRRASGFWSTPKAKLARCLRNRYGTYRHRSTNKSHVTGLAGNTQH